jgi:hypothetical protein
LIVQNDTALEQIENTDSDIETSSKEEVKRRTGIDHHDVFQSVSHDLHDGFAREGDPPSFPKNIAVEHWANDDQLGETIPSSQSHVPASAIYQSGQLDHMPQPPNPYSCFHLRPLQQHYPQGYFLQQSQAREHHAVRWNPTNNAALAEPVEINGLVCSSRHPPQTSLGLVPNAAETRNPQAVPATRQEQLWRSTPHGPYLKKTRNPKKLVRNTFLNEWLRRNRPDIRLPDSSGQGFKEQNRVFDNLSQQEQEAVNAFAIRKAEAEQAKRREDGTAVYRNVVEPKEANNRHGSGQRNGTSTINLQNMPRAHMQDHGDTHNLDQLIGLVPTAHSHHGGYELIANTKVSNLPDHAEDVDYAKRQRQQQVDPSLNDSRPNQPYEIALEYRSGDYPFNQLRPEHRASYIDNSMAWPQNFSFIAREPSMSNVAARTPYHEATPVMPVSGSMHGMFHPTASLTAYPLCTIQHTNQMSAYTYVTGGLWDGNGLMYNVLHPTNPYDFHFHPQYDGMSPMQNIDMGHGLALSHQDWERHSNAGSPSMENLQYQRAENNAVTNGSDGRKRKQVEEDNNEDGSGEDDEDANYSASKRMRII